MGRRRRVRPGWRGDFCRAAAACVRCGWACVVWREHLAGPWPPWLRSSSSHCQGEGGDKLLSPLFSKCSLRGLSSVRPVACCLLSVPAALPSFHICYYTTDSTELLLGATSSDLYSSESTMGFLSLKYECLRVWLCGWMRGQFWGPIYMGKEIWNGDPTAAPCAAVQAGVDSTRRRAQTIHVETSENSNNLRIGCQQQRTTHGTNTAGTNLGIRLVDERPCAAREGLGGGCLGGRKLAPESLVCSETAGWRSLVMPVIEQTGAYTDGSGADYTVHRLSLEIQQTVTMCAASTFETSNRTDGRVMGNDSHNAAPNLMDPRFDWGAYYLWTDRGCAERRDLSIPARVTAIYGDRTSPLVLPPALQSAVGANIGGVAPSLLSFVDSWLTVGVTDGNADSKIAATTGFGWGSWDETNGLVATDASVFWVDRDEAAAVRLTTIAQLVLPAGVGFRASVNVAGLRSNALGDAGQGQQQPHLAACESTNTTTFGTLTVTCRNYDMFLNTVGTRSAIFRSPTEPPPPTSVQFNQRDVIFRHDYPGPAEDISDEDSKTQVEAKGEDEDCPLEAFESGVQAFYEAHSVANVLSVGLSLAMPSLMVRYGTGVFSTQVDVPRCLRGHSIGIVLTPG